MIDDLIEMLPVDLSISSFVFFVLSALYININGSHKENRGLKNVNILFVRWRVWTSQYIIYTDREGGKSCLNNQKEVRQQVFHEFPAPAEDFSWDFVTHVFSSVSNVRGKTEN